MKKLLLILLCLPLIFTSCFKSEGCIEGNCIDGYGIFTYDNGSSQYVGEWRDGKKNGKGTFKNSKGTYVGEFKDGEFCGKGTFTYKFSENKDEESGNWKDGKLNGYGTRIWSKDYDETHQGKYIGNFRDGKRDGYGTEWYSWGDYFEGNFDCCSKRNPTQEGTMYRLDGTSEYGTWETVTRYKRTRK